MSPKADTRQGAVYSITHVPTGRVYIGASLQVGVRWKQHKGLLEAGQHYNAGLQEAYAADGPGAFSFAVLEEVANLEDLGAKEAEWAAKLEAHKTGFNVGACSHPSAQAETFSPEIRAAVKARLKEKGLTQADLARATGKHPNAISRTLNGHKDGGKVPEIWAAILEALDLRLTVEARGEDRRAGEEKTGQG